MARMTLKEKVLAQMRQDRGFTATVLASKTGSHPDSVRKALLKMLRSKDPEVRFRELIKNPAAGLRPTHEWFLIES